MMQITAAKVGLLSILAISSTRAAEVPDGAIFFPGEPSFGVNVHTTGNGKELAAIGARWVRLDFSWAGIEDVERGKYAFEGYDKTVEHYRSHGINVLGLLAWHYYCGKFYPEPKSDEDFATAVQGFADFSRACAEHFKGKVKVWELGNEPECFPKGGVNNPERYTKLARAAAKAIREADPDVVVGACSCAWMDRGFLSKCLEAGLLKDGAINAVTFHGYHRANLMPESGLAEDVGWLRNEIRKSAPPGKNVMVVDSERGYAQEAFLKPKHWASWRNIVYTESEQAAYLARHFLEEMFFGVEVSIWYKDMSGESNFSLYEGGPGSRIRPMGYVMKNLALLFDLNPKQMVNDAYTVTLVDLPDDLSDPNVVVPVRSFLRRYAKDEKDKPRERLIIALWNPVEAFDGRILQSRQRIGESYYEAWRAISPEDKVELPVQVTIAGLTKDRVANSCVYNLLATEENKRDTAVKLEFGENSATSETIKVGPTPTVIVVDLK